MRTLSEVHGHTFIGAIVRPESVVVDLGAHKGEFARDIYTAFGCQVHAVEANPALAATIPPQPGLTVHHLAIVGDNGPLTLHLSTNLEASTILDRGGVGAVAVDGVTLQEFMRTRRIEGVDLVKFDIEGAEIAALDACSNAFLQTLPQITVEFHDFIGLTPVPTIKRVVARLEGLGFFTLKMWRSAWGDTLFVNRYTQTATFQELQYAKWVTRPQRWVQKARQRMR